VPIEEEEEKEEEEEEEEEEVRLFGYLKRHLLRCTVT
jgi:hypothetical protein